MIGKAAFATGLGVGYLLGTKAGRERFEQIKDQSQHLWHSPTVEQAKGTAQSQAGKFLDDGRQLANERLHRQQSGDVPLGPGPGRSYS